MFNLFQSLGFTAWKPLISRSIHRLIHRKCGYPKVYPQLQKITAVGLNALRTKNCTLLQCGEAK